MQTLCQSLILVLLIFGIFPNLYQDFNGRPAKEPFGFIGAVVTLGYTAVAFLVCWKAGAFSTLLP